MFSFHPMNMAKSSISNFTIFLGKYYKDEISLDLIKPWQTLGYRGSESRFHLNFKFIAGTSCSLFYSQTANGAITMSDTNWDTL